MSGEIKNTFIRGSFVLGGKYCDHCSKKGITCQEGGLFLSNIPLGEMKVRIELIRTFKIFGRLQDCKIASGKVLQEDGAIQIRAAAERAIKKALDEIGPEDIKEEALDFNPNIWSQSR